MRAEEGPHKAAPPISAMSSLGHLRRAWHQGQGVPGSGGEK